MDSNSNLFERLEQEYPNENPLPTTAPKLFETGVHAQDLPPATGKAEPIAVGPTDTLTTLSGEWSFFSFGLPYIYLPFPSDPLNHFRAEQNDEFTAGFIQFDQPIFAGFVTPTGDAAWNHTLLAVPKERFDAWLGFCETLAVVDRKRKYFGRVKHQVIEIVDPVVLHRSGITATLPTPVQLTVFGAETNRGQIYTKPLEGHPTLWQIASNKFVSDQVASFSRRLFERDENPYKQEQ